MEALEKERHGAVRKCPEKGHKNNQRDGVGGQAGEVRTI